MIYVDYYHDTFIESFMYDMFLFILWNYGICLNAENGHGMKNFNTNPKLLV